jgi:hypothetical protein
MRGQRFLILPRRWIGKGATHAATRPAIFGRLTLQAPRPPHHFIRGITTRFSIFGFYQMRRGQVAHLRAGMVEGLRSILDKVGKRAEPATDPAKRLDHALTDSTVSLRSASYAAIRSASTACHAFDSASRVPADRRLDQLRSRLRLIRQSGRQVLAGRNNAARHQACWLHRLPFLTPSNAHHAHREGCINPKGCQIRKIPAKSAGRNTRMRVKAGSKIERNVNRMAARASRKPVGAF